ncbi:hypothetical protein GCM10027449_00510 [Sinomonas notoginsengisoli]|uniref:hypothetical protein n=1 Tax=Sinomonas notoginsengisoli TaxID=1457311 RepID=UPI001F34AF1E|nr:hypothetical protein [Sinomonas notoginsengisoli]
MRDLASILRDLPEGSGPPPWPGLEYVRGWGTFGLPFDSGHVLALRVFLQGTFGAYRTPWHRDPAGSWSIHVDGPRLETACPRYYGAACEFTGFSRISLEWEGPARLHVRMDEPALDWTVEATSSPLLDAVNMVSSRLPLATWRPDGLVRAREVMARWLGLANMVMRGVMPSGHSGTLMPSQMYFVNRSTAILDGLDLGRPVRVKANPLLGEVALPARGILAIGQAVWEPLPGAAP